MQAPPLGSLSLHMCAARYLVFGNVTATLPSLLCMDKVPNCKFRRAEAGQELKAGSMHSKQRNMPTNESSKKKLY